MKCRVCKGHGCEMDDHGIQYDDPCKWCDGNGDEPFPEDFQSAEEILEAHLRDIANEINN